MIHKFRMWFSHNLNCFFFPQTTQEDSLEWYSIWSILIIKKSRCTTMNFDLSLWIFWNCNISNRSSHVSNRLYQLVKQMQMFELDFYILIIFLLRWYFPLLKDSDLCLVRESQCWNMLKSYISELRHQLSYFPFLKYVKELHLQAI